MSSVPGMVAAIWIERGSFSSPVTVSGISKMGGSGGGISMKEDIRCHYKHVIIIQRMKICETIV